jgi:hypothetical protein
MKTSIKLALFREHELVFLALQGKVHLNKKAHEFNPYTMFLFFTADN